VFVVSMGLVNIYNLQTGLQLDTFVGSSSVGTDTTIILGTTDVSIAETIVYNTDVNTTIVDQIIGYLIQTYFAAMSLPLTFPNTSVSTTN